MKPQNVRLLRGLFICSTKYMWVDCGLPEFGIKLLVTGNAMSVHVTIVCPFWLSAAAPSWRYRNTCGPRWWMANLGSVSSRRHKELTAKSKASLSSKASFLFPVFLKKTRLGTSSPKGMAHRCFPHSCFSQQQSSSHLQTRHWRAAQNQ